MRESDIRRRDTHNTYLELVAADAAVLARQTNVFDEVVCPACAGDDHEPAFTKAGFHYVSCRTCDSLFVNPRPSFAVLMQLYANSPSTKYWVEEFFRPMEQARREKIFRPRASYVARRFPELSTRRIGDIGAGFGIFLEELRNAWPSADLLAIEPSEDMADILRARGLPVLQRMLEDVGSNEAGFDLLTAFELFEHLHDPLAFLQQVRTLLRPGGHLYLTTLNGQGFDIQVLWEHAKAVSPPHHLNFLNPGAMQGLLVRAGFEVVEVSTPGELDWDIIEGGWRAGESNPGRLLRTIAEHGTPKAKAALQRWIRDYGFSSHMRAVARRPD